jgi:hypothetical protein
MINSMKNRIVFFIIILVPSFVCSQETDSLAEHFSREVRAGLLEKHLAVIASDAYEGRETGRKGQKMAAQYIRQEFLRLGLKPGNDTSFIQTYPLVVRKPGNIDFVVNGTGYVYKKDFYTLPRPDFEDQTLEANEVVFVGYGINDSVSGYSDYKKGTNINGKVVVIYYGEPVKADGNFLISGNAEQSEWSISLLKKMNTAKKGGARAVLFVSSEDPAAIQKNSRGSGERIKTPSGKSEKKETLVFHISKAMADKMMGIDLDAFNKKNLAKGKPKTISRKLKLKIDIHRDEPGYSGENVIGIIEGSSKKDQYVFITAHYDHLGIINNEIYNGADDDGSGTVSVLALAQAFEKAKEQGHGPERSIVFMTVSGEEKGLLGSAWYVDHPTIPLKNIVCDLNIDMIGRVDDIHKAEQNYVYIIGSDKLSSELHLLNEKANTDHTKLKLDYTYNDPNDPNRFYYRSDHYNFAKNDIPVVFYFNGVHADYHQETDEISKINFGLMEKRARLVFFTAWELANRPGRIVVDSHKK